jgi:hypothetical protein
MHEIVGIGEKILKHGAQIDTTAGRSLDQHIDRAGASDSGSRRSGRARDGDLDAAAQDQFERGQQIAAFAPRAGIKRHRVLDRAKPTSAVSTCVGRGKSFSDAAVMMPSVPSLPMNSCLRS